MRRTLRTAAGGFGGLGVPFVGVDELREVGVSSPAENPYAAAVGESSLWRFPAAAVREPSPVENPYRSCGRILPMENPYCSCESALPCGESLRQL